MKETLREILQRRPVTIPTYDFKTHSRYALCVIDCIKTMCASVNRGQEEQEIGAADVVLIEGILVLYDPDVRRLMDMKLFVDTDSDTRLSRRGGYSAYSVHPKGGGCVL